jgi:hypothetical protein
MKLTHQMLRQIIKETLFEAVDPDIDTDPDDADMSEFLPGFTKDEEFRTYDQINKWKDELVKLYAPGTTYARNFMKALPKLPPFNEKVGRERWENFLQGQIEKGDPDSAKYSDPDMFEKIVQGHVKSDKEDWEDLVANEDKYENIYNKLKTGLRFTFPGGKWPKKEAIKFVWKELDGALGTVRTKSTSEVAKIWGGDDFVPFVMPEGQIALMTIDSKWWANPGTSLGEKENTIKHELEHVISSIFDSIKSSIEYEIDSNTTTDFYSKLWGQQYGDLTDLEKAVGNAALDDGPHSTLSQRSLYRSIFSIKNLPKSFLLKKTSFKSGKAKKVAIGETLIGFSNGYFLRFEEQRAFLKAYLAAHGGVMTKEMMRDLCYRKKQILSFDWENKTESEITKFLKNMRGNDLDAFPPALIMLLNCDDPDETVGQINQMAKSFPSGKPKTATV